MDKRGGRDERGRRGQARWLARAWRLLLPLAASALACGAPRAPTKTDLPTGTEKSSSSPTREPSPAPLIETNAAAPLDVAATPAVATVLGCGDGLAVTGEADVAQGAPMYFYEDRPALGMSESGPVYVYYDHDSPGIFVARLDASGGKKSVRPVALPDKDERTHIAAAFREKNTAIAAAVYHGPKDADIELTMLDEHDKSLYTVPIDPSPDLDGMPAIAWGRDEIAIAWARGTYPSHDRMRIAFVDPKTGKIKQSYDFADNMAPGAPSMAWDNERYWVAWQRDVMRPGLAFSMISPKTAPGLAGTAGVGGGMNPSLLFTPLGMAMAFDADRSIYFGIFNQLGIPTLGPKRILDHPDPMGGPRKPMLAFDGKNFAVTYEVTFHASVMQAHETEVDAAIVDPAGKASPALRLHPPSSAGEMPAILWTGKEWLVVYNRDRLVQGKTAEVVATKVACLDAPKAETAAAPGPCEATTKKAPPDLAVDPRKRMVAALPLADGGFASVQIAIDTREVMFVRIDRDGKTTARVPLASKDDPREPVIARLRAGFALAWVDHDGHPTVVLVDEKGEKPKQVVFAGDPLYTGRVGLAATDKGLVIAYGSGGSVMTALVDESGRTLRAPSAALSARFPAGDCALGKGPQGLFLVYQTNTERSETSVLWGVRLDDSGNVIGQPALVTSPHGFVQEPSVMGTPNGFLVTATGPFSREVLVIELGPKGEVQRPEREWLSSYGFGAFGARLDAHDVRVFGFAGAALQERKVCP